MNEKNSGDFWPNEIMISLGVAVVTFFFLNVISTWELSLKQEIGFALLAAFLYLLFGKYIWALLEGFWIGW